MSKICLARVDRIGDLILTLPSEKFWKSKNPGDEIRWLVAANLDFVMEGYRAGGAEGNGTSAHLAGAAKNFSEKIAEMKRLARALRSENYDIIVAFHVPWWVAAAIFFSGVKRRIGPASQWFSWIFFNRRLRQRRSQAVQNEARYNLDLVAFALGLPAGGPPANLDGHIDAGVEPAPLAAAGSALTLWRAELLKRGLIEKKFVLIHPGMGGSARNWPPLFYKYLAEQLTRRGIPVAVTGSSLDQKFLKETQIFQVEGVHDITNQTNGPAVLAVLSLAGAVVAPSTGIAHLASSLGTPIAGIYSPVKVQAPRRWAPLGENKKVFVPDVDCPGVRSCLREACPHFDCMQRIPVDSVASYVMGIL